MKSSNKHLIQVIVSSKLFQYVQAKSWSSHLHHANKLDCQITIGLSVRNPIEFPDLLPLNVIKTLWRVK